MNNKTLLITGATGFLGSRLSRYWAVKGHQVLALRRRESKIDEESVSVKWFTIEDGLSLPFEAVEKIDAVVHVATDYGRNGRSAVDVAKANVIYPLELMQNCVVHQCPLFLNADSFFNAENINYKYLSSYALTKKHFLNWGEIYAKAGYVNFANARIEHLYGEGDSKSKFITDIAHRLISNEPKIDLTAGLQMRDFIYIDDVVTAFDAIIEKSPRGLTHFGVGTGQATKIRDVVSFMRDYCGASTDLNFGALPYREGEIEKSQANNAGLQSIGWTPSHTVKSGISRMLKLEASLVRFNESKAP